MKEYTVSLFGHRIIENWDSVEFYLGKIVRKLAEQYECLLFLMGRDGDFDRIAASVIHKLIKCLSCDISITWVMAYQRAEYTKTSLSLKSITVRLKYVVKHLWLILKPPYR